VYNTDVVSPPVIRSEDSEANAQAVSSNTLRSPQKAKIEGDAMVEFEEHVEFTGVGSVIRTYRESRDLTLDVVAQRMKIHKSTLHRYETNESPVSDGDIKKIAKALRVKATLLMKDCLFALRPKLSKSPFGQLLNSMIDAEESQTTKG
jgi:transcriptional regulator with XRE-family HTH domain